MSSRSEPLPEHVSEAVVVLGECADVTALSRELQGAHLRLEPMFPGATSPADRGWYLLVPESAICDDDLDALLQHLRGIKGVDAAYRKPPGEPPLQTPP